MKPQARTFCSLQFSIGGTLQLKKSFASKVGPLHGVKVLDLGRILAAPYCSMLLGDLGAEIFKIEEPTHGDDTRTWGPPFTKNGHESAYFISVNRNKKSVAVDLKRPEGLDIIYQLAKNCDIVLENFPPGKAEKLGIGYSKLSEINPSLIYASVTGFGPDGPGANRLAYDVMVAGILLCHAVYVDSITGPESGEPVKVGVAITDVCSGLFCHGAIIAALYARDRSTDKKGQKIDVSLLETQVATLVNVGSNYLIGGVETKPTGTQHVSIVPYQAFQTQDGHITVGALNDSQFQRLCTLLKREDLSSDDRFKTNPLRVKHRTILIPILKQEFLTKTSKEWLHVLEQHHVPCGPINTMSQVFQDPQVLHRKMLREIDHPTAGNIKLAGVPVKFSETEADIRLHPPVLGEHTFQVLKEELGYSETKIQELSDKGVCFVGNMQKKQ